MEQNKSVTHIMKTQNRTRVAIRISCRKVACHGIPAVITIINIVLGMDVDEWIRSRTPSWNKTESKNV
jgi:Fe-S cluster assembly iron-binding protein IscA